MNKLEIGNWHEKKGYKYGKYKQAIDYIKANGYAAFIEIAKLWNGTFGKYH